MLCPGCYHDVDPEGGRCPLCGRETPVPGPAVPPEGERFAGEGPRRRGIPWEERDRLGTFGALGDTLQGSLFRPAVFFREMPPGGRIGSAILYAAVIGTLSAAVAMMWQRVLGDPVQWVGEGWRAEWRLPHFPRYAWYAGLAAMPLIVAASTVMRSLVLHFSLLVLGGAKESYEATLKVVAYATSASAFGVFPFVGSPIAFLWRVRLLVVGLREVHRVTTGRAFLAWLLPFVALACLSAAAFAALALVMAKLWPSMGDLLEV